MRRKDDLDLPISAAITAIETMIPGRRPGDPKEDPRWIALTQLHKMNREMLEHSTMTEFQAKRARLAAQRAYAETKCRLEILRIDLGIEGETEESNEQE